MSEKSDTLFGLFFETTEFFLFEPAIENGKKRERERMELERL